MSWHADKVKFKAHLIRFISDGIMCILNVFMLFMGVLYLYLSRHYNYWKKKGVPHLKPSPYIGNLKQLLRIKECPGQFLASLYFKGVGKPYFGFFIFDRPALIIRDPELIKHILLKEFDHFTDRFVTADEKIDPMGGKNIFLIKGSRWRHLRSNLSTTFSSGKLKRMFPLIVKCAQDLRDYVGENGSPKDNLLDVKDVMARSAIDVIASCMYGIDSGALREPHGEFRKFGKNVFAFSPKRAIEMLAFFFTPGLIRFVKGMFFQRHSDKFLRGVFTEAVKERETGESFRNDLVDVLLSLKRKKLEEKEIKGITKKKDTEELKTLEYTDEDLVAQAVIFFTAGFETTSITTGFALYELAMHPQVQKKLREQIGQVLDTHDGHITYEAIRDMKYLDMVLSETLRMYPPLPFLDRNCVKDFTIPGTDIVIEKNTPLYIPTLGMHRDPILFPEPLKFLPERFAPENKESIHRFSYLPFGEGPHMCIGMRFGLLAAKTELVHLLSSWEVVPCTETPRTMVLSPFLFFTRHFNHWVKKGVPCLTPNPFVGNLLPMLRLQECPGVLVASLYNGAPKHPYVGFFVFDRPALLIREPEMVKNILVKDFEYFSDQHTSADESADPLGAKNIFLLKGPKWKYVKEIVVISATDVITKCLFSIEGDSLKKEDANFRKYGKKVFDFTLMRALELLTFVFVPSLNKLGCSIFFQKETDAFIKTKFKELIGERRTDRLHQKNDLINLLVKLTDSSSERNETELTDEDVVAQAAIFFTAGFESTSITTSFALYELALFPSIQWRLRAEIGAVLARHGGNITYQSVNEMTYLNMVIKETLRMYPTLPFLDRNCVRDYVLPGTDIVIEENTPVFIPVLGIQRDPKYFPRPDHFDPERFSEENKKFLTPYTYLLFGEGPHMCIAKRFGMISAMTTLVHLLSHFEVSPCEATPVPMVLSPKVLFLRSLDPIPLATCIGCYDNYPSRIGRACDEPSILNPAALTSILKQFKTQYSVLHCFIREGSEQSVLNAAAVLQTQMVAFLNRWGQGRRKRGVCTVQGVILALDYR
uniref:(California timema) hypothetical protein n=1 Tax=Timema californicum TaxID=61474 RepID=A0A7R9IY99_TIMCA|nr:unnamed protein product [Timema californicum]